MKKKFFIVIFLLLIFGLCDASILEEKTNFSVGTIKKIFFEDLNNDKNLEIVILSKNKISVFDSSGNLLWSYSDEDINSVNIADLNSDNKKEILITTGKVIAEIAKFSLWILDNNGKVLLKYPQSEVGTSVIFNTVETEDLDGNNYKEIIIGTSKGIMTLRDNYKEVLWYNNALMPNDRIEKILVSDINSDGKKEIIAKSFSKIYAVDFDGTPFWNYTIADGIDNLIEGISDLMKKNLILISKKNEIFIVDIQGNLTKQISIPENLKGVIIEDLDKDMQKEIIVYSEKNATCFKNFILNWTYSFNETIIEVFYENFDLDNEKELVFFTTSELLAFYPLNLTLKFRSETPYKAKKIFLVDLNGDDEKEILLWEEGILHIFSIDKKFWKKKIADEIYENALKKLSMKDYEVSEMKAKEALKIYEEIQNSAGLLNVKSLLQEIQQRKITDKRERANSFYESAMSFYKYGDYENSTLYLQMANKIFAELNDISEMEKCNLLLDEIKNASQRIEKPAELLSTETTIETTIEKKEFIFDEKKSILVLWILLILILLTVLFLRKLKRGKEK
ncbi:MAG: hypothetical protein QW802_00330 [Candidatus Altiarchaeota archaeon]